MTALTIQFAEDYFQKIGISEKMQRKYNLQSATFRKLFRWTKCPECERWTRMYGFEAPNKYRDGKVEPVNFPPVEEINCFVMSLTRPHGRPQFGICPNNHPVIGFWGYVAHEGFGFLRMRAL